MFTTEDIIGDIVYISFKDAERYQDIGISENAAHFQIKGYDGFGVWVSHPGLVVVNSNNKPNNKENSKKHIDANFLISWDNIKTIMHYPDRVDYDFPSEFDLNIGFKKRNSK